MTENPKAPRKPRYLPDPSFQTTASDEWGGTLLPCAALWGGYALEDPVLEATPLKRADWATLHAYMIRRFGPPHVGGDDYKRLSASWMLTSPDPFAFVEVSPSLTGPGFSFIPHVVALPGTGRVMQASDLALPPERVLAVKSAYRTVLLDLLRPVCVHDRHINALGEMGNSALDDALLEHDEDSGEPLFEVRFHPTSGWAMPLGMFGGEDWSSLCRIVHHIGGGDIQAGRASVVALLQRAAFEKAAQADWPTQRLMLLDAGAAFDKVASGLGLTADQVATFKSEMAALRDRESDKTGLLAEMTDARIADATDLLNGLGLGKGRIRKSVTRFQGEHTEQQAWQELKDIAASDFPEQALPKDIFGVGQSLPRMLVEGFEQAGRQDLVEWVNRTLVRPGGLSTLTMIALHLAETCRRAQKATKDGTASSDGEAVAPGP